MGDFWVHLKLRKTFLMFFYRNVKFCRTELCENIFQALRHEARFLDSDYLWQMIDPKSKNQSTRWKFPQSSRPKKLSFHIQNVEMFIFSTVVELSWYSEFLVFKQSIITSALKHWRFCKDIKEEPQIWKDGWMDGVILLEDNAPTHWALFIKQFMTNKNITVLRHHP